MWGNGGSCRDEVEVELRIRWPAQLQHVSLPHLSLTATTLGELVDSYGNFVRIHISMKPISRKFLMSNMSRVAKVVVHNDRHPNRHYHPLKSKFGRDI